MVRAPLVGGMKFVAETKSGHEVIMDAAPNVGGEDSAARPAEMPLVGLAGCTGMDVVSILRKMRQNFTRFEVEIDGLERAEEHPKVWLELRVIFHVEGDLNPERLTRAIDLSRSRYCSVSAGMRGVTKIHYRYVLNGETVDLPDVVET
ncbi:MAG TPA: OsmC family peroxiredoxin [Bacteroidetes bacterium]|nr:OsmC family peroxiredoxin [Bacteroidota bacterium]